jgi:hypothetical protein
MPTYRLKGASMLGSVKWVFRMPLICEQCHETLGIVDVAEECVGLSAAQVGEQWPQLAPEVATHEVFCPAVTGP